MDKGLMIYIVDEGRWETLCLCPTKRGGSATADEVRDLGEDEGFFFRGGRWETDSATFRWWQEVADARRTACAVLGDEVYADFAEWLDSSLDMEMEKDVAGNLARFADRIREELRESRREDEDCGRGEDALRAVEAYLEVA